MKETTETLIYDYTGVLIYPSDYIYWIDSSYGHIPVLLGPLRYKDAHSRFNKDCEFFTSEHDARIYREHIFNCNKNELR